MAILPPADGSSLAEAEVRRVVAGLAAEAGFGTPRLSRADARSLVIVTPHRFAMLALNALKDKRREPKPRPIGWRFLIEAEGEPVAAAEAIGTAVDSYQFGGLNEGPLVDGFVEALRQAERLGAAQESRFEPRLLLVPALNVAALWLAESDGAPNAFRPHDLFLPLPPSEGELAPFKVLDGEAFVAALRQLARDVPEDGGVRGG